MGQQSHLTRLALGRSAYEPLRSSTTEEPVEVEDGSKETVCNGAPASKSSPYEQQYDSKGYPENLASRLLNRQTRRAQNDVLARFGVCYQVGENSQASKSQLLKDFSSIDDAKTKAVRRENEVGLLIAAADLGLFCLAGTCLLGLRHRMEAFKFYAGMPILDIIKAEWKHLGPLHFLLGGVPASMAYLVLDLGRHCFIRSLYNGFTRRVVWKVTSRKHRHQIRWVMDVIEDILKGASFIIIGPLEIFAVLQRLGLIPGWPLLPNPLALIPFTPISLIQAPTLPSSIDLHACVHFISSLILSPMTLWWILFYGKIHVDKKLYGYMRVALPKPDNPNAYSIKGALEDDLDNDTVPGLGFIKDHDDITVGVEGSLIDEMKKDILALVNCFLSLFSSPISRKREKEIEEENSSDSEEELSHIPHYEVGTHSRPLSEGRQFPSIEESIGAMQPTIIPGPANEDTPYHYHNGETQTETSNIPNISLPRSSRSTTLSLRPSSVVTPPPDPETHAPPTSPTDATPTNAFQSPIELSNLPQNNETSMNNVVETQPAGPPNIPPTAPTYHRVTALTAHLADAMGSHLSTHLADIIFLPLESLFIRSVALTFFSLPFLMPPSPPIQSSPFVALPTHISPVAEILRAQIFPTGTWFGLGLRGGGDRMADYAARMTLCAGLEMCVGYAVWQLGAGVVWWLGFRWFQWRIS